ncbi:hypothetical protein [Streptomyces sp. H39-C1]|uniref:hypothetical protein n=1 Tax=Streptomyces sp. H39-C1 TaxID=3004355 RepID=UPI0022AF9FA2|nr:hypothetical protein [Streptomyces sp. H39-C1]MCZ4102655.1 hypothetical protein [Streptomyces sp. H39-C1]
MTTLPTRTQQMDTAVAGILTHLHRLQAAADTDNPAALAHALRLIHDHRNRDIGVLRALYNVLDTLADAVRDVDMDAEQAVMAGDWLDDAAAHAENEVGERIDRARTILADAAAAITVGGVPQR